MYTAPASLLLFNPDLITWTREKHKGTKIKFYENKRKPLYIFLLHCLAAISPSLLKVILVAEVTRKKERKIIRE